MVMAEPEMRSPGGGVAEDSQLRRNHRHREVHSRPLGRQSSIYSLTLDEFQRTISGSGKNFGSMNMDEFLASIWTAEENQQQQDSAPANESGSDFTTGPAVVDGEKATGLSSPGSLNRQGSLSLPPPLCRKTVDEVWSEIHGGGQPSEVRRESGGEEAGNPDSAHTQPTFGEMTLEDFLVKAGVVRENQSDSPASSARHSNQLQFGIYQSKNSNSNMGVGFTPRQSNPRTATAGGRYTVNQPSAYGGRIGNGGVGYMTGGGMMRSVSPVSHSDGLMVGGMTDGENHFGMDVGGFRNRKRIIDGPVEKVVERRQRRMIKNRESAARSRARKQAYTVELEAELNQLKEENKQLKEALAELERKRRLQYIEDMRLKMPSKARKTVERLRMMRRTMSCPF